MLSTPISQQSWNMDSNIERIVGEIPTETALNIVFRMDHLKCFCGRHLSDIIFKELIAPIELKKTQTLSKYL